MSLPRRVQLSTSGLQQSPLTPSPCYKVQNLPLVALSPSPHLLAVLAVHLPLPFSLITSRLYISHHSSDQVANVKSQAYLLSFQVSNDSSLSDSNELNGKEQEMAIKSPPKGKKHITSKVRSQLFQLITNILRMFLSRNSSLTNPQRCQANQHSKSLKTRNYSSGLKLNGSVIPLS